MFSISESQLNSSNLGSNLINDSAGALVTFEGWVRNSNDDKTVISLEYECYKTLAEKVGNKILEEVREKFGVLDISCIHRIGKLSVGELAVWVGVTAVHRAEAFAACRLIIDEIKTRLPIWKKEEYLNGTSSWVNCSENEAHASHKNHKSAELSEKEFYVRQTKMPEIGRSGQDKIKTGSVLVIGAGGLGCAALQYLAGAGVGRIGICDFDDVDATNLHRQPLYSIPDIGFKKATIASRRLNALNPFIEISDITEKFDASNSQRLLEGYQLILDCTDNLAAKFAIADAARSFGKSLLQASVDGFHGQLLLWRPRQIKASDVNSNHRNSFNSDYEGQCYRCLWPSEELLHREAEDCIQNCAESGILGAVPGLLGVMQALEAIKLLLELPTPLLGNIVIFDLLTLSSQTIKTRQNQNCPACGKSEESKQRISSDRSYTSYTSPTSDNSVNSSSAHDSTYAEQEFELHWHVLKTRSPRELVYVDIRSEDEIAQDSITNKKLAGRTLYHWPVTEIDLDKLELDKNSTYLFFCQSGRRSGKLVMRLRTKGFKNVFSLSQGAESFSLKNVDSPQDFARNQYPG